MFTPKRIPRRCINCGASDTQDIPMIARRYDGMTVFVCRDREACAKRFQATQTEQPTLDWTAIEFKPGT